MNDFLYRLYRLSQTTRQTPREDFVSLCLGRHLEVDGPFAVGFFSGLANVLDAHGQPASSRAARQIEAWCAAPDDARRLEVRGQVPARSTTGGADGAVDLLLRLQVDDHRLELVLEAKVAAGVVPDASQLRRYADAFPSARVIALVQPGAVAAVEAWPAASWNDVLRALPTQEGLGLLSRAREDFRGLLAEAAIGDQRLIVSDRAWTHAKTASRWFHDKLQERLGRLVVELFPNDASRAQVRAALENDDTLDEPWESWGVGFRRGQPITGTRVLGVCLGLDVGPHSDQVVWTLEVTPSNEALAARLRGEDAAGWWEVRAGRGSFVTELWVSEGPRNLTIDDFRAVVTQGRMALKQLHAHSDAPLHMVGERPVPHAPRGVSIPDLRAGLRAWTSVNAALYTLEEEVLSVLCARLGAGRPRWDGDALRTPSLPGAAAQRVRLGPGEHLASLWLEIEGGDAAAWTRLLDCAGRWQQRPDSPGPVELDRNEAVVTVHLREQTWRGAEVTACLLDLAWAGLGIQPL